MNELKYKISRCMCGMPSPNDRESQKSHNKSTFHKKWLWGEIQKDIDILQSVNKDGRMEYTEHDIKLTIDGKPIKIDVLLQTTLRALFTYQKTLGTVSNILMYRVDDTINGFQDISDKYHEDDLNE